MEPISGLVAGTVITLTAEELGVVAVTAGIVGGATVVLTTFSVVCVTLCAAKLIVTVKNRSTQRRKAKETAKEAESLTWFDTLTMDDWQPSNA